MGLRAIALGAVWIALAAATAPACEVVDFLAVPLPDGDPVKVAIETAYPGVTVEDGEVVLASKKRLPLGEVRQVAPAERLTTATIAEQFLYRYPLAFDLAARDTPWFDPGRLRNDAFFRELYPGGKRGVYRSLEAMRYPGLRIKSEFAATTRFCADVQLRAALADIAALGAGMDKFFDQPGGSFNWREIAGTNRLSAHSFGIAVDINSRLGGYWRWTGDKEGRVGAYSNRIPEDLVRSFERRGFIWGGKWHHFDGMHFEYRPELILHARLVGG